MIPIPGTKKVKYIEENAGAVEVSLSADEIAQIETIKAKYPNVGEKY